MKRTTYQVPELRDENDNIIQQGAFGKNTALANSTNDGWIDYVANDLEALYNNTMGGTGGEINTETITGKTGTITNLTATTVKADTLTADALNGPLTGNVTGDLTGNVTGNVTGDLTGNVTGNVTGDLTGNVTGDVTGNLTGNVTGTADKAVADGDGNNIVNTYVTKSAVQGELTNYLPLSGGTLTGDVDITGDLSVSGAIYSSDPASGENSGQVPTTAWVQKLVAEALKTAKNEIYKQAKLDAHPVGSYYWSNDSTNPATLFGGTWEALPAGYTLIAQGSGNDDFGSYTYTAGHKYGERKHQLTTDEMPAHKHEQGDWMWAVSARFNTGSYSIQGASSGNAITYSEGKASQRVWTASSGGDAPHNNIPPVIAAFAWKRTA